MVGIAEKGRKWEVEFRFLCETRGLDCQDVAKKKLPHDLVVNGLKVQCKDLTWCSDGNGKKCGHVRIAKGGTGSSTPYHVSEIDIFALRINARIYIVPSSSIQKNTEGVVKLKFWRSRAWKWMDAWFHLENRTSTVKEDRRLF